MKRWFDFQLFDKAGRVVLSVDHIVSWVEGTMANPKTTITMSTGDVHVVRADPDAMSAIVMGEPDRQFVGMIGTVCT